MIDDGEYGAVGKSKNLEKTFPLPFYSPQIPHAMTWVRTRAAAKGSWGLTA